MICPPLLLRIHVEERGRRKFGLWLPLGLLWPPLLVLAFLALPILIGIAVIATWRGKRLAMLRATPQLLMVLCALRGLQVHVRSRRELVHLALW